MLPFCEWVAQKYCPVRKSAERQYFCAYKRRNRVGRESFCPDFWSTASKFFYPSFFFNNRVTVVKRRVCYTRVFGRYAKNLRRNLRNRQISRLCNGPVEQALLPSRARTYVNVRSRSLRNPVMWHYRRNFTSIIIGNNTIGSRLIQRNYLLNNW